MSKSANRYAREKSSGSNATMRRTNLDRDEDCETGESCNIFYHLCFIAITTPIPIIYTLIKGLRMPFSTDYCHTFLLITRNETSQTK